MCRMTAKTRYMRSVSVWNIKIERMERLLGTCNLICFQGSFLFLMISGIYAQEVISLYNGIPPGSEGWDWEETAIEGVPGQKVLFNVVHPTITYYRANDSIRKNEAFLVAPGGTFHILAIENEGSEVAKFLNGLGIDAFVLKYRLAQIKGNDPIQEMAPLIRKPKVLDSITAPVVEMATKDGITALEWIRLNSERLDLQEDKIGMMGFSAGATLTMSVLLSAEQQLKPKMVAPLYLYKPAVIGEIYPELPTPMFIAAASDYSLKFVPHSIDLYTEWIGKEHPSELHIYESGGHGFGMASKGTASDQWPSDFINWLKQHNWL